jgi:hypothetical protein
MTFQGEHTDPAAPSPCRRGWFRLAVVAVLVIAGGPWAGAAWAKPKSITLPKMVGQCPVIAVARFVGNRTPDKASQTIGLEVVRAIKGDIKPSKYRVAYCDLPTVDPAVTEFVAFFEKGMVWQFVGEPLPLTGKVAACPLHLRGFFDRNAYIVSPGLVTLDQLTTFVAKGTLHYHLRGTLYFPQRGRPDWKAGTRTIDVSYDAIKGKAVVKGLGAPKGLPAQPEVVIGDWQRSRVRLVYDRSLERPLTIQGQVLALDPRAGTLTAKFFASVPDILTERDFEKYCSDARLGRSYYRVQLTCRPAGGQAAPKKLTLFVGRDGRIAQLEGWAGKPLVACSSSGNGRSIALEVPLPEQESLVLFFALGRPREGKDVFTCTFQEELLYALLVNDLPGSLNLRRGKVEHRVATFVAALDGVCYETKRE